MSVRVTEKTATLHCACLLFCTVSAYVSGPFDQSALPTLSALVVHVVAGGTLKMPTVACSEAPLDERYYTTVRTVVLIVLVFIFIGFFFKTVNTPRHRLKQPKFVLRCTQLQVGLTHAIS